MIRIIISLFSLLLLFSCNKKDYYAGIDTSAALEQLSGRLEETTYSLCIDANDSWGWNGGREKVGYLINPKWDDIEWIEKLKHDIMLESKTLESPIMKMIILFDSAANTPTKESWPVSYDKHMLAGYWEYPTGIKQFCWGGVDASNTWNSCEKWD